MLKVNAYRPVRCVACNSGLSAEKPNRTKIQYIESRLTVPVLYLNYHELAEDPESYAGRITRFLDAELNEKANVRRRHKRAFTLKQNRILKKFNGWFPYQHLNSKSKFLNKLWYRYREYQLHVVAFLARFVPQFMVSSEPLIDREYLQRVKEFYAEDWEYALSRTNFGFSALAESVMQKP